MRTNWPRSLREVAPFQTCSNAELDRIGRLVTPSRVPAGRVVLHEGEWGREFVVLLSGQAAVTRDGELLDMLGPGSFAGEMSLLDRAPRVATVTAVTDLDVLVCTSAEFSALLEAAPSVRSEVQRIAAERADENAAAHAAA